jgi:hypothetical protein
MISVELIDLSGRKILEIFEGLASSGRQIYKVDKKLSKGTYFIKFVISGKPAFRNVIVK